MPTVLSLFTGAGGLDLGFERAGFIISQAVEIDQDCVNTIRHNRPLWPVVKADVRDVTYFPPADVLIAGVPCQGFSVGGHRKPSDPRNQLYEEVIRVAEIVKPRFIVIENVFNLKNMKNGNKSFELLIIESLTNIGYSTSCTTYRMSHFNVPQTRKRTIFLAQIGQKPPLLTENATETVARPFLKDMPTTQWGWTSKVHVETGEAPNGEVVPVRLSRTASTGNPIRSLDQPFPAVDTGTVWGWAKGPMRAEKEGKLWRITASQFRSFIMREYARLQTFPNDYEFCGKNNSIRRQIGNAVPVNFAEILANHVKKEIK